MKIIILAGNHKSNEKWLDDAAENFSADFENVEKQRYSHWDEGGWMIDFDKELEKLKQAMAGEKECYILAKSAGSLLAMYGVIKGEIDPKKCFFMGLPLKWADEKQLPLSEWLEKFNVPVELIQNSKDPMASFQEAQEFLKKFGKENIEMIEVPGDTHEYGDFEFLKKEFREFAEKDRENKEMRNVPISENKIR